MKTYVLISVFMGALLSFIPACSGIECYVCEYMLVNTEVAGDARCSPRFFSPVPTQSCSGNCTKSVSSVWTQADKTTTIRITRGCDTNGTCVDSSAINEDSPTNSITACCNQDNCNSATTRRHLGLAAILVLYVMIRALIS